MDDISRESSPEESGVAPVSERQKGPEELVRFERGHVDGVDDAGDPLALGHRLAGAATPLQLDGSVSTSVPDSDPQLDLGALLDPGDVEPCLEVAMTAAGNPGDAEPEAARPVGGAPQEGGEEGLEAAGSTKPAELPVEGPTGDGDGEAPTGDPAGLDTAETGVDEDEARAAVDAEAGEASVEQQLDELGDVELGEDGLPVVPELGDTSELGRVLFVLMLSSRDGLSILRLAQACNTSQKLVEEALDELGGKLRGLGLPVELARVGDTVRWMSTASAFPYLQRLRGVKKLEKLSPAALETLAVIAYRQPVMRSEIEAIRGVKAGPMLRTLLQHKLVKVAGRADVPGRPLQYGTTPHFLERFGLSSLQELPSVKEWKNLG